MSFLSVSLRIVDTNVNHPVVSSTNVYCDTYTTNTNAGKLLLLSFANEAVYRWSVFTDEVLYHQQDGFQT